MTDVNFPQDFYLDDVGVWRLKKEKLAELEKPKPMTNEEYLHSLNTEQLAEWISSVVQKSISIKENNDIVMLESAIWWVEWLKQPHTKE